MTDEEYQQLRTAFESQAQLLQELEAAEVPVVQETAEQAEFRKVQEENEQQIERWRRNPWEYCEHFYGGDW